MRAGHTSAYAELVEPHLPALEKVLRPLARDPDDCQDLVQDTLLRALKNLHLFEGGRFGTWLFRVGINLALTVARRHHVERRLLDPVTGPPISALPRPAANPETQARHGEDARRLSRAISGLPGSCREVFKLRYAKDLTCQEIAVRLGKTPNAISLLLFRARRRLRDELIPQS